MISPWTAEANYKRMCEEYHKYGTLYIAFDFDNTIRDYKTKEPITDVIELLRDLGKAGMKLILYTCEDNIVEKFNFCIKQKIPVLYINANPDINFGGKVYYNVLLDDRAGFAEVRNNLEKFLNEEF